MRKYSMLCQASEEMIKGVKIYHGYYILENNPTEVIRHKLFSYLRYD